MSKLIPLALLATVLGACSSKPSWTEYKRGPVTMQFPCKPKDVVNTFTTKCTTSDGSEWRLSAVEKEVKTAEASLKEAQEYVDQIPNGKKFQVDKFPVKWREARRTNVQEAWLYYKDGWDWTASVTFATPEPPAATEQFFSTFAVAQ
jgi:hypothetical protein